MQRETWIFALRTYKDVPFLHQGRSRSGVDCVGLLSCAADDLGVKNEVKANLRDYERAPNGDMFRRRITDFLVQLPYNRLQPIKTQIKPGDVFVFWIDLKGLPRHVAVYTGENKFGQPTMIHAYAKTPRKVVEQTIDSGYWLPRIDSVWKLPILED